MAFDVCMVKIDSVDTDGSQVIDLPEGFGTPTCCIVFSSTAYFGGVNPHHQARMAVGFSDGTIQRAALTNSRDGRVPLSDTARWKSATYSVLQNVTGGTTARNTGSIAFSEDTITISWDVHDAMAGMIFLVFTGTENLAIGDLTHAYDVDGEYKTVDLGFTPTLLAVAGTTTASAASGSNHASLTFGVAVNDGSETQTSLAFYSKSGAAGGAQCAQAFWTNRIAKPVTESASLDGLILESFDANGTDGFTTKIDGTGGGEAVNNLMYLAIELPADYGARLVQYQVPYDLGDVAYGGVGLTPMAQLTCQSFCAAVFTRKTDVSASIFGVGAGYDSSLYEGCFSYRDEDAANPTECWNRAEDVITDTDNSDGVGNNAAVTKSYDEDGVTWTWTDNDYWGRYGFNLLIGELHSMGSLVNRPGRLASLVNAGLTN